MSQFHAAIQNNFCPHFQNCLRMNENLFGYACQLLFTCRNNKSLTLETFLFLRNSMEGRNSLSKGVNVFIMGCNIWHEETRPSSKIGKNSAQTFSSQE